MNSFQSKSDRKNIFIKGLDNIDLDEQLDMNMNNEEEINFLKYKIEELNKEYIDKLDKINGLNEQIKNKDVLIQTLKKTISSLQEKLSTNEKVKLQMNMQTKQFIETESEVNFLRTEYM